MIKKDKNSLEGISSMANILGLGPDIGNKILTLIDGGASLKDIRVPKKQGHVYTEANALKDEIEYRIKTAKSYEDLNKIGQKLNYAIDNEIYNIGITDLQVNASKKMREIYNKIGEYTGE